MLLQILTNKYFKTFFYYINNKKNYLKKIKNVIIKQKIYIIYIIYYINE
jgi:hypothetical protein